MKQALISFVRRSLRRQVAAPVPAPRELDRAMLRQVVGGDGGTDLPKTGW